MGKTTQNRHVYIHPFFSDVQKLEGSLIAAVVPPELTKVKPVTDMASANIWNQALYDLADEETKALREQADMGIDERNYAAYKLMLKIRNDVSQPVEFNTVSFDWCISCNIALI